MRVKNGVWVVGLILVSFVMVACQGANQTNHTQLNPKSIFFGDGLITGQDVVSENSALVNEEGNCNIITPADEYDIQAFIKTPDGKQELGRENGAELLGVALLRKDVNTGIVDSPHFSVEIKIDRKQSLVIASAGSQLGISPTAFKQTQVCNRVIQVSGQKRIAKIEIVDPIDPNTVLLSKQVTLGPKGGKIKLTPAEIHSVSEQGDGAAGFTARTSIVSDETPSEYFQASQVAVDFKGGQFEVENVELRCMWAVYAVNSYLFPFDVSRDRTQTNFTKNGVGGTSIIGGASEFAISGSFAKSSYTTLNACHIGVFVLDPTSPTHAYLVPEAIPAGSQPPDPGGSIPAYDNTIPNLRDIERKDNAVTDSWENPAGSANPGPNQEGAVATDLGSLFGLQDTTGALCGHLCNKPCTFDHGDLVLANRQPNFDPVVIRNSDKQPQCQTVQWWKYKTEYLSTRVQDNPLANEVSRDVFITELGSPAFVSKDGTQHDVYDVMVLNGMTHDLALHGMCNYGLTLWHNNGDGTFSNKTVGNIHDSTGLALPEEPACAAMGGEPNLALYYHTGLHFDIDDDGKVDFIGGQGGTLDANNFMALDDQDRIYVNIGDIDGDGVDNLREQSVANEFIPGFMSRRTNTLRIKLVREINGLSPYDMYIYRLNDDSFEVWARDKMTKVWVDLSSAADIDAAINQKYANGFIYDMNWDGVLDFVGVTGDDPMVTGKPNRVMKASATGGSTGNFHIKEYNFLMTLIPESFNAFRVADLDVIVPYYVPAVNMDLHDEAGGPPNGFVDSDFDYQCNPWDPNDPRWHDPVTYPNGALYHCWHDFNNRAHGYVGMVGFAGEGSGLTYPSGDLHQRFLFTREPLR